MGSDTNTNPVIEANADKPVNDVQLTDCYWESEEMDVLQDAYLMLRDAGFTRTELNALGELLDTTTLYSAERTESLFERTTEND